MKTNKTYPVPRNRCHIHGFQRLPMICKVFKLTKLEIENAGDVSLYMSIGNTHTHYAVGYDNADVALVCLFVTFRHHPIFPQFLQFFS